MTHAPRHQGHITWDTCREPRHPLSADTDRRSPSQYAQAVTQEEAVARCTELNRTREGGRHWFAKQDVDGEWELVSVLLEGFRQTDPLKASIETKPKPSEPPDPRPSIFRNIPPFGPG